MLIAIVVRKRILDQWIVRINAAARECGLSTAPLCGLKNQLSMLIVKY